MLRVTGDGCEIAGLAMTVRGAVAVRFDTTDEARLLCSLLLEATAIAHTSPGPGDAYLRARGWEPDEFRRVGGAEQLQLYDLLSADAVFWSRYAGVSETRLPLIFDRFVDAEPGSFEELLVAIAGLALGADPGLGGLHAVVAIAPPLADDWIDSRLCCDAAREVLALSPELPLPTVLEVREVEIPGWLLCMTGERGELNRLANAMTEQRLVVESFLQ